MISAARVGRERPGTLAALSAVVLALITAVWWPALHAGFIWIDRIALHDVGWLRDGSNWFDVVRHNFFDWTNYFRPLVVALLVGEARAFDVQAMPMHVVSLGLHLANTLLVGLLAVRMLPAPATAAQRSRTAALAMLLYGLHPALIEPVVWISCQFELAVTFFCLLGLLGNSAIQRVWLRAPVVAACFLLAALAKEAAVAFPLLLVSYDWIATRSSGNERARDAIAALLRRQWLVYASVALAGVIYLVLRFLVLGSFAPAANVASQPLLEHAQLVCWLLLTYWRILLWPMYGQGPLHEVDTQRFAAIDPRLLACDIAAVALIVTTCILFARRRALGGLCVAATLALLPVLHLLPVDFDSSLYHERYALTAAAVAIPLLPRVLAEAAARLGGRLRPWTIIVSVIFVAWLGASVLNIRVTVPLWSDETRLWSWAARQNPDSVLARNYLLAAYADHGRRDEARAVAGSLLTDRRSCPVCLVNVANFALQENDVPTARAALSRAEPMLRYVPQRRLVALFELARGQLSRIDGDDAGAETRFRHAVELAPQDPRAHMTLALLLADERRVPEAEEHAQRALVLFAPDERQAEAARFAQALAGSGEKPP